MSVNSDDAVRYYSHFLRETIQVGTGAETCHTQPAGDI